MPELHAPREELASFLDTNTPWADVAERYGYRTGREARHAALQAERELSETSE